MLTSMGLFWDPSILAPTQTILRQMDTRVEWFFYLTEDGTYPKVRWDFKSPNPNLGAHVQYIKVFIFKNYRGPVL